MKNRLTFISNSSSSSFIIGLKNKELELTQEYILERIFKITDKTGLLYPIAESLAKCILDNCEEYTYEQLCSDYCVDSKEDFPEMVQKVILNLDLSNCKIFYGYFSDDSDTIESGMVPLDIDYEDENIIFQKEAYY